MTDWMKKTALEMAEAMQAGQTTSLELVEASLERIDALNGTLNAFITVDREGALATARRVDELREEGADLHPLAGVPVAVKDNIVTSGLETTCASKILAGWLPPYDATVVARLKEAMLPIVGKTNLDEFAMGSSTETSAFGSTRNPWHVGKVPGGSSGGSAAAVASYMVPFALGTDTGGSIRQPAALTGTVGFKPTYGAVSRYGAVALASSMDQVGPIARTVADAAALQDVISGHDPNDSTSLDLDVNVSEAAGNSSDVLAGLKVGVVKELQGEGYQKEVVEALNRAVQAMEERGAEIKEVSCPSFKQSLPAYYLIMPAEAFSNLGRFDGVRFGNRFEPEGVESPTARDVMESTRGQGFGTEVKRRIILGTYVLSADHFEEGYEGAQKVRTLTIEDLDRAFEEVDVLITPTTPTTAFDLGDDLDPVEMYLNDVATVPANLAGVPAISLPSGVDSAGLPTSIQLVAPTKRDDLAYRVAAAVEDAISGSVEAPPYAVDVDFTQEGEA